MAHFTDTTNYITLHVLLLLHMKGSKLKKKLDFSLKQTRQKPRARQLSSLSFTHTHTHMGNLALQYRPSGHGGMLFYKMLQEQ